MSLVSRVTAAVSALRGKAAPGVPLAVPPERGWYTVHDFYPGAFQADLKIDRNAAMANWAWFACVTLIASDMGKIRLRLVEKSANTWQETDSPAFSPVLRKPNAFQTRQQFIEQWVISKLIHGNTYILKERDQRGIVVALYILEPRFVQPLVAQDGSVYYRLQVDYLSGVVETDVIAPASEIIHDRENCLFHPLVGISPIYACGLAATQGLKIQENAVRFFQNMSRPSGLLTTPGELSDDLAKRYGHEWNENYSGRNVGKTAVLGNGLSYSPISTNAIDAQLVEQLKISAEMVCSSLHVPAFKIGAGTIPAGQKVEDLNQIYYTDCLQARMEAVENLLDDGLGIGDGVQVGGRQIGTEFDLDDLLKMDSLSQATLVDTLAKAGVMKPNEGRARFGLLPVKGGDTPYLQQQNFSLAALAKRDALANPFVIDKPATNPTPSSDGPAVTADPATKALDDMSVALKAITDRLSAVDEIIQSKKADEDVALLLRSLQARFDSESVCV